MAIEIGSPEALAVIMADKRLARLEADKANQARKQEAIKESGLKVWRVRTPATVVQTVATKDRNEAIEVALYSRVGVRRWISQYRGQRHRVSGPWAGWMAGGRPRSIHEASGRGVEGPVKIHAARITRPDPRLADTTGGPARGHGHSRRVGKAGAHRCFIQRNEGSVEQDQGGRHRGGGQRRPADDRR